MKKLTVVAAVIVVLLCLSETGFAQKKRRKKKIVAPSITMPTAEKAQCKEEILYPVATVTDNLAIDPSNPPVAPPVVTKPCPKNSTVGAITPLKIISKPKPSYTTDARKNNVNGMVRLRVTFLASGIIGSITPISGLPYGLTAQASAAARAIRFEPQKVNGKPVSVTKTVEYSFTLY